MASAHLGDTAIVLWVEAVVGVFLVSQPNKPHQTVTNQQRSVFRLHQMHEMQPIVTDECSVCPSVCLSQMH